MHSIMRKKPLNMKRREFVRQCLGLSGGLLLASSVPALMNGGIAYADSGHAPIRKPIPATGDRLSSIGMGTWRTFNVGSAPALLAQRVEILRHFLQSGGECIDSSPMYGSSREVIGYCLNVLNKQGANLTDKVFSADKIWTYEEAATRIQYDESADLWGLTSFDLMQVHNLLAWEVHLPVLMEMKAKGQLRYVGITTSHGRRHSDLEQIMRKYPLDFVQLTYNARDRAVEDRLLPLARDRGIAVIVNRPFDGGQLVDDLQRQQIALPDWAGSVQCTNWPQLLLKFITSHPAVTCAIPATSRLEHMRENMGALTGSLPDEPLRRELLNYLSRQPGLRGMRPA